MGLILLGGLVMAVCGLLALGLLVTDNLDSKRNDNLSYIGMVGFALCVIGFLFFL